MNVKPGISGEIYRSNKQRWKDDLNMHKKKLQGMRSGLDRWRYLCSHEVHASHCEPLERHCEQIGIPVERDKLDWKAFHASMAGVGKPEPPELAEIPVIDEERQAICFADGGKAPF